MKATSIAQQLLPWFKQHGRYNLPWQGDNLYHIWLSEIMLQQTQVSTVINYFERFITAFPTIASLANASGDAVMRHWAGLGYYARARNLHKSAKIITKQYHSAFPIQFEQVLALPGIGQSTAGAILALGLDQHHAILDGNVKRVLSRYYAIDTPINQSQTIGKLWHYANEQTPQKNIKAYTQAIMDLGATLCTRVKPNCENCPLNHHCLGFKNNQQHQLPYKQKSKPKPIKSTYMLIPLKQEKILLEKRPQNGIWGGLWSLPETQIIPPNVRGSTSYIKLNTFRHSFTHYHLDITPIVMKIPTEKINFSIRKDNRWFMLNNIQVGVPKPVQKIIDIIKDTEIKPLT